MEGVVAGLLLLLVCAKMHLYMCTISYYMRQPNRVKSKKTPSLHIYSESCYNSSSSIQEREREGVINLMDFVRVAQTPPLLTNRQTNVNTLDCIGPKVSFNFTSGPVNFYVRNI